MTRCPSILQFRRRRLDQKGAFVSLTVEPAERAPEKGLKSGALGLISSVVIAVASTAPAYSLAATLGFVVVAIGVQAPIVTVLAFVPMWFVSIAFASDEQGRPRLRRELHLGDASLHPASGLDGWLGRPGRRHHRHGQPLPDRRSVHVRPLQRQRNRTRRVEPVGTCWWESAGSSS